MDNLIALATIAQNIYSRWIFRHLLYGMIAIAALTIITGVMVSAILIGIFYAAYQALLNLGVAPLSATLCTTGLATVVALLFIFITIVFLRRLREMPKRLLQKKTPGVSQAGDVIDAFFTGFLEPRPPKGCL